jgi:hypothetical protein
VGGESGKWTAKYLQTNDRVREVCVEIANESWCWSPTGYVHVLLELIF